MTTTTMQLKIQRGRFAQHLAGAAAGAMHAVLAAFKLPAPNKPATKTEMAAREAADVRRMAQAYSHTDPGFAADLYAAAARHENLAG